MVWKVYYNFKKEINNLVFYPPPLYDLIMTQEKTNGNSFYDML